MKTKLQDALLNKIWLDHKIGDKYTMDGKPELWKIAYYPIMEDSITHKIFNEPRALIEAPSSFKGVKGTDFREVPLRFLVKNTEITPPSKKC